MIGADEIRNSVFLDTETTGLGSRDEIVEVAVVNHAGEVLIDTLVSPSVPVSAEAAGVHGINDDALRGAPLFPEIVPQLAAVLKGRIVVIYNVDFDTRMLEQSARAYGLPADVAVLFAAIDYRCAMLYYAAYRKEPGRYGYRRQKLTDAVRQQGIRMPGYLQAHRALADAEMTRRLILKITQRDFQSPQT